MKQKTWAVLISLCLLVGMLPTTVLAEGDRGEESSGMNGEAVGIATREQLAELLNDTGTKEGVYQLQNNITINTNELRQGAPAGGEYSFNGTLDGAGYTITVQDDAASGGSFAPLFDTLRGSVQDLNVEFMGDVRGTTVAYDILDESDQTEIALRGIHVTVYGSVLPAEHNYLEHKGSLLDGPHNYGNWYIHFRGQPAYLSTGFAWYLWGASLSDIRLDITGDVGTADRLDKDTTAAGFAYFALLGDHAESAVYQDLTIQIGGNIQSYTGQPDPTQSPYVCAYASAYGFATGTFDNSMMGGRTLTELNRVTITAGDIVADSQVGGSSAAGFARNMAGSAFYCTVNAGEIRAVNEKEDGTAPYQYWGQAFASGFAAITSMAPFPSRGEFAYNTVNVRAIYAQTNSERAASLACQAHATGFINELAGASAQSTPSYHHNQVIIAEDLTALANQGAGICSGFVRYCQSSVEAETFYENSVHVGGDLYARSYASESTAAGFVYSHYAAFRDCSVTVEGNITSESPSQSMVGGFTAFSHFGNHYTIDQCDVHIGGDLYAMSQNSGTMFAGGLMSVCLGSTSNAATRISDNTVQVDGDIKIQGEIGVDGPAGLIAGFVQGGTSRGSRVVLDRNRFVGQEVLLPVSGDDSLYTNFVGQIELGALEQTGNSVLFTTPEGKQYSADVEPIPDEASPQYVLRWKLTHLQEIVPQYTITAAAGANGSISPSGSISAAQGESLTFIITADPGYHIHDVMVDGVSQGAVSTYTFSEIDSSHTITAVFASNSSGGGTTEDDYTLRYDTNGGQRIGSESRGYSWTKKYAELPVPVRSGYVFAGWYRDSKLTNPVTEDIQVNRSTVTLYAAWNRDPGDPTGNGVSAWLNTDTHVAYLNGFGDGTFGPDRNMTRGQAAQMFYNLLRDQDVSVTVSFTDVPADAWCADAVNTLASLGMVRGIGDGRFAPDRPITRAEFVVIAMRFANSTTEGSAAFSDVSQEDWFYDHVVGAVHYGWITGYSDGTFRPDAPITRAEVTTIVNRMLDRAADESYADRHEGALKIFSDVPRGYWAYYQITEAANFHEYVRNGTEEEWTSVG